MLRIYKKTLSLLLVLTGLLGAYFFLGDREERAEAMKSQTEKFVPADFGEIESFSFIWPTDEFRLESAKTANGLEWRFALPKPLPVDGEKVSSFLAELRELSLGAPISTESPESFGLREVSRYIRLNGKKGELTLKLGDKNPLDDRVYGKIQSKPEVYLIDALPLESLDKGAEAFVSHKILAFHPSDVISLWPSTSQTPPWRVLKIDGRWQAKAPYEVKADGTRVEQILEILTSLEWKDEEPVPREGSAFAPPRGEGILSLAVTLSAPKHGPVTATAREVEIVFVPVQGQEGEFQVWVSNSPFIYTLKLEAATLDVLKSGFNQIHHTEAFDFFPWQVETVEWKMGGKSGTMGREGDAEKRTALLDALTGLKISNFTRVSKADFKSEAPSLSGTILIKGEGAGASDQALNFYFSKDGERNRLIVLNDPFTLNSPPDFFEVWDVSRDLRELF